MAGEQQLAPLTVYSAQPTLRLDGREVPTARELMVAMEMHEQEGGMSRIELRFVNIVSTRNGGAELAFDSKAFGFGKLLTVYAGHEHGPMEIFRGHITAIEANYLEDSEPEFVVLAEDELQKARFSRSTKAHGDLQVSALLQRIGQIAGLRDAASPSVSIGSQTQLNESALAFLRRVLGRWDCDAQASGGELQSAERQNVRRTEVTLTLHSQLRRARVTADLSHQATEVTVSGWNPEQGQRVKATSRGQSLGPGTGKKGSEIFDLAFGIRSEHVGHLAVTTSEEATALAHAAFDQRARGFVKLEGEAEGNPRIRAGAHVTVRGMGEFDNTYYVVRCCHRFDLSAGYITRFTAECAYLGGR